MTPAEPPGTDPRFPPAPDRPAPFGWLSTVLLTLGLLASHVWMHDFFPNYHCPNSLSRSYLTLSIVDDGTFQIDSWIERFADMQDKAEYEGHYYSDKAPGYSVLLAPIAALTRQFVPIEDFTTMAVALRILGLSIPIVLFWLAVRRYYGRLVDDAHLGTAIVVAGAFGTPFFIYATQLFSHAMAGVLLFCSFLLLRRPEPGSDSSFARLGPFAAGALSGIAFTVDYIVVLAVPALLATAWLTGARRFRDVAEFSVGCAVPLLAWMAYNVWCFDHPLRVGFHLHADPTYGEPYRAGFLGIQPPAWSDFTLLLTSPARGLFYIAPVLALGLFGFFRIARDPAYRYDGVACGAAVLAIVAFAATTVDPAAGWSVSSRYLVPTIPFLLAGLAGFLRGAGTVRIATFVGLALVGVVVTPATAVTFPAFPAELRDPIHQLVWPLVAAGHFGPTHFAWLLGDGAPIAFLMVFVIAGGSLCVVAYRFSGAGGLVVALGIAAGALGLQSVVPHSPDDARFQRIGLAYVEMLMGYREDPREAAAASEPAAPKPNVVLISIDTLRAGNIGAYGYGRPTTPTIDRLAEEAILYESAFAHSASTLTSHASLFTSLLPADHGAFRWRNTALPETRVTLAEALQTNGWATAGFHGGGQLSPDFGIGQGFDVFEEVPAQDLAQAARRACNWIESGGERPFFVFVHSYEIHHPYRPTSEHLDALGGTYDGPLPDHIEIEEHIRRINSRGKKRLEIDDADLQHIVDTYDAELRSADEGVADLIACLERSGLYDDTMIVLTSDHGEEFREHGVVGWHGHTLYDELLRVPLLVKLPGGKLGGTRIERVVRGIDVAPTVLAAVGVAAPDAFQGSDLLAASTARGAYAISELDGMSNGRVVRSIRGERWKLYDGRLYDLRADPEERVDLSQRHPRVTRRLTAALAAATPRREATEDPPSGKLEVSPETRARLRELGYIDGPQ